MRVCLVAFAAVLTSSACGRGVIGGQGGGAGGGTGGAGGGTGGGTTTTVTGLPCDVAGLLVAKCVSCHGTPPSGSAPYAIASRDDLTRAAPNFPGETVAQRSSTRMTAATSPMPPAGYPAATAAELLAFEGWMDAGMPAGTCTLTVDAGPTCDSNTFWTRGLDGSENMKPGFACKACHLGQNFQGQNPTHEDKPDRAYEYMGTVFPNLHDKDECLSTPPPSVFVDILEPDGGLRLTLSVWRPSGNFMGVTLGTPAPFRARVRHGAASVEMQSVQTEGDCNQCHTEAGAGGAAGRILLPR